MVRLTNGGADDATPGLVPGLFISWVPYAVRGI